MTTPLSIADLRREYARANLSERDVDPDPIAQFRRWLDEALHAAVNEPTAMTLATASHDGAPSARLVLLKGVDERGFVFYTDFRSRKGRELEANPRAALVFFWPEVERQVRVEGEVQRVATEEAEAYFRSRPEGSRLGAWTSHQSDVITGRDVLETAYADARARFGGDIPLPPHWGGYRLRPRSIELWQGRPNRLHDRLRYRRGADGAWIIERLSP
ncbi:MAG TPA: pyridoxamine 5'-phosphate oxidase [Gemmatimonadaceae bacterium]|nr:pyridoxamine 5'-phosphate oxidase [Gemmatimonadaceae bacterium]